MNRRPHFPLPPIAAVAVPVRGSDLLQNSMGREKEGKRKRKRKEDRVGVVDSPYSTAVYDY